MSYLSRFRADLRRIAPAEAEDLLRALDLVLGQERHEHFVLGQAAATPAPELPENPAELGDMLEYLRLSGCSGVLAFGRLGIRFTLQDPGLMGPIHVKGDSAQEVVKAAFDQREVVRPREAA